MGFQTWSLMDGGIALVDEAGNSVFPTAREVFAAVFRADDPSVLERFPAAGPADALPSLRFSRFPAHSAVRLTGSPPDTLRATLGVRAGEEFHEIAPDQDQLIANGCWYPVDVEALTEAWDWLAGLGIEPGVELSLPNLVRLRRFADPPVVIVDEASAAAGDVAAMQSLPAGALHGLMAELYSYQKDGISFLTMIAGQSAGCVLADEMGLGKTLQVIGVLTSEVNHGRIQNLIIVPATLVENWRREFQTFSPELSVLIHAGAQRAGVASRLKGWDVVITSYETAVRDQVILSAVRWNLLVVDEAQFIKNPNAQRTESVKRIPRRVSVAVTGTPVENSLEDYWSVVDFAVPGMLGDLAGFRADFANDVDHARRLGSIAEPIILRRLVRDVAQDLPDLIEIPQVVEMSPRLAGAYEEARQKVLAGTKGGAAGLALLTDLRMLCTHPLLKQSEWGEPASDMPKYQRLMEILEEIFLREDKALIFTSFTAMIDLLLTDLGSRWPSGFLHYIDGRVPVADRQNIIDAFSAHPRHGALVLNPQAAGVGLNITAANHVIHYNPEWNPARTDQATRRAYRRRQERPVTVHHLFFADSVEEAIMARSRFKRTLADEAVQGHDGNVEPQFIIDALTLSPLGTHSNGVNA